MVDTFVRDRSELKDSPQVLWIDVHTGLGPFGKDSVELQEHIEYPPQGERKNNNEDDLELNDYFTTAYSVTSRGDGGESTAEAFKEYDLDV